VRVAGLRRPGSALDPLGSGTPDPQLEKRLGT
jgi:hypothetical protein